MNRQWLAAWRRLASLFQRHRLDRELAAELESHLAAHIADNLRAGMTPQDARRHAVLRLGGVAQVEELYRRRRGIPFVEHFARDVRFGLRTLRNSPGLTAVAVLTLGLGIGVNGAIFGVMNALLFRRLPVSEPERLVTMNRSGSGPTHSYPDYRDIRDRTRTFAGVAAYRFAPMNLGGSAAPARIWGYLATGNYFDVIGVRPIVGRAFTADDDRAPGSHPVIVLSYGCWQRRFGGDSSIAGRSVLVNGLPYTILGVMPPKFRGTELFFAPDVWVPMAMQAKIESGNDWLERRQTHNIFVIGRLAPGVTRPQAESAVNIVAGELAREHPTLNEGLRITLSPPGLAGTLLRGPVVGFATALLIVAAMVLLLACVNLTGLLLARVADTQRDRAIRLALGARRGDLIRRALVESALLGTGGAAVAIGLTVWVAVALTAWHPPVDFPLTASIDVDYRVVGFALALGVLSTLLVGIVPAMHGRRTDVVTALKEEQTRTSVRWHARDVIVGLQVALALVLLVGSLLIVRSLQQAAAIDVGFTPAGAVTLRVDLGLQGYGGIRGRAFAPALVERLARLPGIESAAAANSLPLNLDTSNTNVFVEGRPDPRASEVPSALYYQVTPGFFRTMRTRLVAGRDFSDSDTADSPRVAIVNRAFATNIVGDRDPIGTRFRSGRSGPWTEIVGVAQTGKYQALGEAPKAVIFYPLAQRYNPTTTIVVRTSLDEGAALELVRRTVHDIDPQLAIFDDGPLTELLALPMFPMQIAAGLLTLFGVLAIVLVSIGTYGLVSYSIARRTREICIRLAIGASSAQIIRVILGRTAVICATGAALGAAIAFAGAPLVSPLLLGIQPRDPGMFLVAGVTLAIVAIVATWLPTRRALSSEPATLLRQD